MKIVYVCEGCGVEYDNPTTARKCEATDPGKRLVEVGDIVFGSAGFGWYDGDKRWVSNPDILVKPKCQHKDGRNCFDDCCTYRFYYVVTTIDVEKHRIRYHLETNAMEGQQGHRGGYTYNIHHITPTKVKNPPAFVVKDSKALIGRTRKGLL